MCGIHSLRPLPCSTQQSHAPHWRYSACIWRPLCINLYSCSHMAQARRPAQWRGDDTRLCVTRTHGGVGGPRTFGGTAAAGVRGERRRHHCRHHRSGRHHSHRRCHSRCRWRGAAAAACVCAPVGRYSAVDCRAKRYSPRSPLSSPLLLVTHLLRCYYVYVPLFYIVLGRMMKSVLSLMADAGLEVRFSSERDLRPVVVSMPKVRTIVLHSRRCPIHSSADSFVCRFIL